MLASRSAFIVVGLILTGGLGFYIGQSPISGLQAELSAVEQNNTQLENYIIALEQENQEFKDELEEILDNFTLQNAIFSNLLGELEETNELYNESLEDYNEVWEKYYDLLLEYQGEPVKPVGGMDVTEIPGIINGDWSDGNEGWLTQGVSNLVGGVKYLHENEHGTFTTQTIYLENITQGIKFDIKPQPFGGEISFQVSLKGATVFDQRYIGVNSNYEWETIVIPFRCLLTMREQYNLNVEDNYEIRFIVKAGEESGSNIAFDNISLVKIDYK
jgi:hypothetical protein